MPRYSFWQGSENKSIPSQIVRQINRQRLVKKFMVQFPRQVRCKQTKNISINTHAYILLFMGFLLRVVVFVPAKKTTTTALTNVRTNNQTNKEIMEGGRKEQRRHTVGTGEVSSKGGRGRDGRIIE